jgi:hypothetical protein
MNPVDELRQNAEVAAAVMRLVVPVCDPMLAGGAEGLEMLRQLRAAGHTALAEAATTTLIASLATTVVAYVMEDGRSFDDPGSRALLSRCCQDLIERCRDDPPLIPAATLTIEDRRITGRQVL